jgi:hypothetical protein
VAIGASEIVLSHYGEFGPLDVQLGKTDELFESVSGLNLTQALNSLNTRTADLFKSVLVDLRSSSNGQISTKLAADIASRLAIGVYEKIYSQIDPAQLGAIERAINIASDYGKRLQTPNVKAGAVDRLVSRYPSHNFIIDRKEAQELFNLVREPNALEEELAECISWLTRQPHSSAFTLKLNQPPKEEPVAQVQDAAHLSEAANKEGQNGSSVEEARTHTGTEGEKQRRGADNEAPSGQRPRAQARPRAVK